MLHDEKNTWPVIVENLRVRKIDTSLLHPHGVHVPNGVAFEDVLAEVRIVDSQMAMITPKSLDEARRVLKYVIVIGHELAYAQHVASKKDRMCSKIENMMECGMHLDNRVGHKQFNSAVEDVMNVGTAGDIQEKLDRISNVICHALSHIPLDENEDMLTASYSLRYDSQRQKVDDLKLSNVRLQIIMKPEWYGPIMEIVYEKQIDGREKIARQISINTKYNSMMGLLRTTQTFSEDQLSLLQDTIDDYCETYLVQNGNRDVTNYLHTLQSGHIRNQIRRFGNLFRYANIGFEAYIGTIRRYLQHRTQNGGHGGKGGIKVGNARQAMRIAKRVSVHMMATISKHDKPTYYEDTMARGKKTRIDIEPMLPQQEAAVPIDED